MKNVTRMKRIEVACEIYNSKCFNDYEEKEIIEDIMEKEEDENKEDNEERVETKKVEVDKGEGDDDDDEDNKDQEEDNREWYFLKFLH